MGESGKLLAIEKMTQAGIAPEAVGVFAYYYDVLVGGETGMTPEATIDPIGDLPRLEDLETNPDVAQTALERTVVIKLNGGLGTSMGMDKAKSLLEAHDDRSFLDLIVAQTGVVRERFGVKLPLLLMNSFRTRDDTLKGLASYPDLRVGDLPLDFLQNREPKLTSTDLSPVSWPREPELEWCPPGHGDLYTAVKASGLLAHLLQEGYRYAFVSNADNLGARIDSRILTWFVESGLSFASESCRRTPADRKGGHLAGRRSDGRLILRETAQTSPEDMEAFSNTERHRFFNTNNLWIDLAALDEKLDETDGILGLPLIRNTKPVDPSDPGSPEVIQIETAMGAAIEVFDQAGALEVDRSRFLPVKTTDQLLALRSDAYHVDDEETVRLVPSRSVPPLVELDEVYRLIDDFDTRFPHGPPSLRNAESLVVRGDWVFGADVKVSGRVEIEPPDGGQGSIPDDEHLHGDGS